MINYLGVSQQHNKRLIRNYVMYIEKKIAWSRSYIRAKDVKRLWKQLKKYRKRKFTVKRISLTSIRRRMR